MQKELAFVNEKNTALEGQLQRLFTSGMNEAPPANQKETPPPSEELEVLQKEVEALKAQNEKYRGHYKKENQKRIKLEEVNKTLNQENAELKDTLKGYQREVNEKELNLAREASEIEEVERCKLLERECVKLRNALRERRDEAEARHCADEEQIQRHSKTIKVYEVAVKKLQKELLAYQVKAFATPRAGPPVQESKPSGKPSSTVSPEPEPDVAPEVTADEMTAPTESPAPPLLSAERGKMLEELKTTYEKRLESLEAHKKAEMKQLLVHNRELKQALASCQEELQEKKRVLNQLQRERAASRQSFLAESMSTPGKFGFSGRSSPEPTPLSVGADLLSPSQSIMLNEIESRYDPENMSVTEAVQLENEALLQRLSIMQEEKWSMSGHIEDLQHRCANQQEELKIQSNMLNHIISVKNTILPPGQEGSPQSNLKFLQTLLQETLEKNLTLEKENDNLKLKVARHE
ncbi:hypothetical protein ADEAN_000464200 [Angomonas deanei]|uniref:Uncharacterized protein n=1 Tax=Angomonas deanei TaxID=59799 RepID=A0A7G2CE60_9TRYP|nr:hypothetical protein ADEAN_000464200 [Angomonas deanei]